MLKLITSIPGQVDSQFKKETLHEQDIQQIKNHIVISSLTSNPTLLVVNNNKKVRIDMINNTILHNKTTDELQEICLRYFGENAKIQNV